MSFYDPSAGRVAFYCRLSTHSETERGFCLFSAVRYLPESSMKGGGEAQQTGKRSELPHFCVLLNIWLHQMSGNCMARCDVPQFRRTMARRAINASKHGSPWKGTRRRKYMGGRERKMLKINKVKTNKKCSREKKSFVFVNVWTLWTNSNGGEKVSREGIKIASCRNR